MIGPATLVLALALAAPTATPAQANKLSILFTGDNGGEVSPCG